MCESQRECERAAQAFSFASTPTVNSANNWLAAERFCSTTRIFFFFCKSSKKRELHSAKEVLSPGIMKTLGQCEGKWNQYCVSVIDKVKLKTTNKKNPRKFNIHRSFHDNREQMENSRWELLQVLSVQLTNCYQTAAVCLAHTPSAAHICTAVWIISGMCALQHYHTIAVICLKQIPSSLIWGSSRKRCEFSGDSV